MDPQNLKDGPQGLRRISPTPETLSGDRASELSKEKGKEGKSRWLSQLKEWVSVSEPSTQALKNIRKIHTKSWHYTR